jgi:capsular exopolysaccharide synthesis family protein
MRWYYEPLKRFAWVIILVSIVAAAGAYLYESRVVKPTYQATAIMEVNVGAQVGTSSGGSVYNSQQYASTAASLVDSTPVAEAALKNIYTPDTTPFGLTGTVTPPQWDRSLRMYLVKGGLAHDPNLTGAMSPSSLLSTAAIIAVPNSQLINVSVASGDPVLARDAANALATAGVNRQQQVQQAIVNQIQTALKKRLSNDATNLAIARNSRSQTLKNGTTVSQLRTDINDVNAALLTLQTSQAQSATTLTLYNAAQTPSSPVGPHPLRTAAVAGALAFILLLAVFLLREYFATTLRTPEEVAQVLGGPPVLGAILKQQSGATRPGMIVADQPRSSTAEAFRVIRTSLMYSNIDHPPRLILTTSGREGEGKTTMAINIAATIAELGQRVLLVDADLRRPSLHREFGMENRVGLTTALLRASDESLAATIQRSSTLNLDVLVSGPLPPNPAELLSSARMHEILMQLSGQYDTVIVDSPPLLAVADPAVLSTIVDFVLVVADVNQATVQHMMRAKDILEGVGSKVDGVVLNKLIDDSRSGYYSYYYRSDHEYVYGARPSDGKRERTSAASGAGGNGRGPSGSS